MHPSLSLTPVHTRARSDRVVYRSLVAERVDLTRRAAGESPGALKYEDYFFLALDPAIGIYTNQSFRTIGGEKYQTRVPL